MGDKAWKRAERELASLFGSHRSPPQGSEVSDFETSLLGFEVKERKDVPKWLLGAMEQSERNTSGGKIPVVLIHPLGNRYKDDLAIMRVKDLLDLIAKVIEE